jgi:hypothetical protein
LSTRSWTGYPLAGLHGLLQVGHLLLDGLSVRMGTAFGAILTPLALSAIVLLWARSSWEPKSQSRDRRMAAMLVLATLASPHLFGYDLMLFLSPFFVVWRLYPQGHVRTPVRRRPAPRHDCAPLGVLARRPRAQPQRSKPFSTWAFHKTAALQVGVPLALFWAWLVVRPTLDEASESRTRAPTP